MDVTNYAVCKSTGNRSVQIKEINNFNRSKDSGCHIYPEPERCKTPERFSVTPDLDYRVAESFNHHFVVQLCRIL